MKHVIRRTLQPSILLGLLSLLGCGGVKTVGPNNPPPQRTAVQCHVVRDECIQLDAGGSCSQYEPHTFDGITCTLDVAHGCNDFCTASAQLLGVIRGCSSTLMNTPYPAPFCDWTGNPGAPESDSVTCNRNGRMCTSAAGAPCTQWGGVVSPTITRCLNTKQLAAYGVCSPPAINGNSIYYGYTTVSSYTQNVTCPGAALTSGDRVYGVTPGANITANIGSQPVTLTTAGGRAVVGRDCDPIEGVCVVKRLKELRVRLRPTTILGVSFKDIEISTSQSINLDSQGRVPAGSDVFDIRAVAGTNPVFTSFAPQSPLPVVASPTATTFSLSGSVSFRMETSSGSLGVSSNLNIGGDSRYRSLARGDVDGDGRSDILLAGGSGWTTIPGAISGGDGSFFAFVDSQNNFAAWAATAGAVPLSGDFDGDGHADVALTGVAGWATIPIAFSNGNNTFRVTNTAVPNFPAWAATAGAKIVSGDFNGDGRSDLAISGPSGWGSVPVAFSNGDGSFLVTNTALANFPVWASASGAQMVAGDFNADGRVDLALTGGAGWNTVPMAFSNGSGGFSTALMSIGIFPGWASTAGAKLVTGDFNGDHYTDIAITGPTGWGSVPIAMSNGSGAYAAVNQPLADFPTWASQTGAKAVGGDFDGDGLADIALTGGFSPGGSAWTTVPVAYSRGDGSFRVTNASVASFPFWSTNPGAKPVGGG